MPSSRGILFTLLAALLLFPLPLRAAVTLRYLDGSLVEERLFLKRGSGELKLPPTLVPGSVRVIPDPGAEVVDVRRKTVTPTPTQERELTSLKKERERLSYRLEALEAKERIFEKAARTQSGRVPKKTKTNPDPLATIREGTAYAVAQLEGVIAARRGAEKRVREIDARIALLSGEPAAAGERLVVTVKGGERVVVRYQDRTGGWIPRWRLRMSGDREAVLQVVADGARRGERVVPAPTAGEDVPAWTVGEASTAATVACSVDSIVERTTGAGEVEATLSCPPLPVLFAGPVDCFKSGAYVGEGKTTSVDGGRITLLCGTRPAGEREVRK